MAIDLDDTGQRRLILTGGQLGSVDQQVLRAFADQLTLALESKELREDALRSRGTGRDRCPAAFAAPGRLPRPPHAAGLDQGLCHQPAAARRGLVTRRPRRPAEHHRHGYRSTRPGGGEPPRHEPAAERRVEPALRAGGPGGRGGRGAGGRCRSTVTAPSSTYPRRFPSSRPIRLCSSGRWPTSCRTRWPGRLRIVPCASRPPVQDRVYLRVDRPRPGDPSRPAGAHLRAVQPGGRHARRRRGRARVWPWRDGFVTRNARRHQRRRHTGWRPDRDHRRWQRGRAIRRERPRASSSTTSRRSAAR